MLCMLWIRRGGMDARTEHATSALQRWRIVAEHHICFLIFVWAKKLTHGLVIIVCVCRMAAFALVSLCGAAPGQQESASIPSGGRKRSAAAAVTVGEKSQRRRGISSAGKAGEDVNFSSLDAALLQKEIQALTHPWYVSTTNRNKLP